MSADGTTGGGPRTMKASEFGPWFGRNHDSIRILGDIVSPMPEEWYAEPAAEQLAWSRGAPAGSLRG